jgi:hypothetical protein
VRTAFTGLSPVGTAENSSGMALVVEKLRGIFKISTVGVPSAALGTGSFDSALQAVCHTTNL